MIENEDKLLNNIKKIMPFKILYTRKYVLNTSINFKKLLEVLLLEYIGLIQYGICF